METPDEKAPLTRDLLAGYLSGDREAERSLFLQHREKLVCRVRSEGWMKGLSKFVSAEDLVDEVLVRALSSGMLEQFEDVRAGSLYRLLSKVLDDVAVDTYRRYGARKRGEGRVHDSYDGDIERAMTGPGERSLPSPDTSPTSKVRAGEILDRCRSLLGDREWEIWRLAEIEEYDSAEIAQRFGTTDSAIRGILHRAKLKLVARLADTLRSAQEGRPF